jgi:hypothetical protein
VHDVRLVFWVIWLSLRGGQHVLRNPISRDEIARVENRLREQVEMPRHMEQERQREEARAAQAGIRNRRGLWIGLVVAFVLLAVALVAALVLGIV